jgi:hypothetical protein
MCKANDLCAGEQEEQRKKAPGASAEGFIAEALRGGGNSRPLQRSQKPGRLGRLGCRGKDRLLVGFEHGKPCRQILRMIGARLVADAEVGAKKRGSEFRDKFFHRIGLIAETLAELAVAAALRARPVGQLMAEGRIISFRRRARRGAGDLFPPLDACQRDVSSRLYQRDGPLSGAGPCSSAGARLIA